MPIDIKNNDMFISKELRMPFKNNMVDKHCKFVYLRPISEIDFHEVKI